MMQFVSPTGSKIVATSEVVYGTCGIHGIDPKTGLPEYDGNGTQVDWDSQHQKTNYAGQRLYIDEDGKSWPFNALKQAAPSEPEKELSEARFAC